MQQNIVPNQARGAIGYGEFVASNLWSSDQMRSGVRENLRQRQLRNVSEALHEQAVLAAALLKQAEAQVKASKEGKPSR